MSDPRDDDREAPWRQLHDESVVFLLHDHFFHRLDANLAMREGGVTAKVAVPVADLAIYNDSGGADDLEFYRRTLAQTEGWAVESLVRLARALRLYESRPDAFALATKAEHVLRAKREGKAAIFLGFEGCKCFEGRIELFQVFYRLGVRQMQLTWAGPNQLVEVAAPGAWSLSGFGREVVAAANELGVVLDLAHAPRRFFAEVAERSRHPVIISHAAPRGAYGSGDIPDEQLDALKANGGLLGLHFCRHYINGPFATLDDFLGTIEYLVERGYEDIVALGGDLFEDDAYFRARHGPPAGATHENWKPFIDELNDVRGMPNVTRGLVGRGYAPAVIKKILGENALRLYRRVLGG